MGNYRLTHQQFPTWNLKTEPSKGWVFFHSKTWELQTESQLDLESSELRTYPQPSEIVRKTLDSKKCSQGVNPVFLIVPEAVESLL